MGGLFLFLLLLLLPWSLLLLLLLRSPALCKANQAPVQDTGVELIKDAEQGNATVVGRVAEVALLWQIDDSSRHLVHLL